MRRRDLATALFLFGFGLLAALEARTLSLGTPARPGPGFFPFYLGVLLCLIALVLILRAVWGANGGRMGEAPPSERPRWGKVLFTLAALLAYALVLETLGFLLTTTLLMLFLFRTVERQRWAVALGGSIATALCAYALFHWLGVQLPSARWPM